MDFLRPGRCSTSVRLFPMDFVFLKALREDCRSLAPAAATPVSPLPPPKATDLRIPRLDRSLLAGPVLLLLSFWLLPRDSGSPAVVERSTVVEAAVVMVLAVIDSLSVLFSLVDMSKDDRMVFRPSLSGISRAEVFLSDSLTEALRDLDRSLFS